MPPVPRLALPFALAAAAVLAVPAGASAPATDAAGSSANVTLRNYSIGFSTRSFEVAQGGGTITLDIRNAARRTKHALSVNGKSSRTLRGGRSQSGFKLRLRPRSKPYTVLCPVGNHASRGMTTKIRVKQR